MFISVKNTTTIIDKYISYVKDAKENNLGNQEYYDEMQHKIYSCLEKLKSISCNKKLIKKYEELIKGTI